jgi:branched-chain amino acid transport system substrate-binding protein
MTVEQNSFTGHAFGMRWFCMMNLIGTVAKRLITVGFGVLLVLVPPAAFGDDNLTINAILPLTGPAAFIGLDEKNAIQIYETLINKSGGVRGRPVHFQIFDDQSSPQVDLQIVNSLIAQHTAVFLGPANSASCSAVEPVVRAGGPVEYCLSPALSPQKGSFVFASARSLGATVGGTARFASSKGYDRIATLSATDASGQAGLQTLEDVLRNYPALHIVDEEKFAPTEITLTAQIAKLKATNPKAVFIHASGPAFGTALRGLKDAGINVPVFTSSSNFSKALLAQYAAFLPRDLYFDGFPWQGGVPPKDRAMRKAYDVFVSGFKAAGVVPTSMSGYSWDPTAIVVSAYGKIGLDATSEQIRDYIANLHNYAGINGTYDFNRDQHGLGDDSAVVVKWSPTHGDIVAASLPGGKPL